MMENRAREIEIGRRESRKESSTEIMYEAGTFLKCIKASKMLITGKIGIEKATRRKIDSSLMI
jgi:hypothetical protein